MGNIKLLELKQAYKKLKSHLYNDKTLLDEKIKLGKFEINLDEKLNNLLEAINDNDISKWTKEIYYSLVPKKLKNMSKNIQDSFYSNKTKQDNYEIESYNIFISAPIEIHLISVLWTMIIGEKLDNKLLGNIKGNRLYRDKNKKFKNESYKLFKPYYDGYQSFRDEAIDMATALHSQNLDVTVLNIDIQEFYYNIPFDFNKLENKYNLTTFMKKIHKTFHEKVENLKPNTKIKIYKSNNFLPIGLVSSSVIANYILAQLDNDIVQNLKPEYYSRYVDDMIFVFSNTNINLESKTIVRDLLYSLKIRSGKKTIRISTHNRNFKLQNEKVKLFQFYKNDSISLLEKFKETINENSSFFNFMPDDEKLFKTLESSSYSIFYNNSENKISSLVGTAKDTLKISRNLTGVLTTISSSKFDKIHLKTYDEQIQHVFSGHNIFELRLHWEKVFSYLYISKNDDLFVKMFKTFYEIIDKIKPLKLSKLREDTKTYFFNSVLFSVSTNPTHFINILVKKIEELELNKYIDIPIEKRINIDNIKVIINSNMFSSHLMTYPLLNYSINEDINTNYLTQKIQNINLKIQLNNDKLEKSPRFIHYHEIILFNHYQFLNNELISQKNIYNIDTEKIFKEYQIFNNFPTKKNNNFPSIDNGEENLYVVSRNKDENKEKLKIGIVSVKVDINDTVNSYVKEANLSYNRLQGIFDILNKSIEKDNKVDLLIFPEVSIPYEWVHLLAKFAKNNTIGIIFGVEHIKIKISEEKILISNYTCVMLPFKTDNHTNLFINFESKKFFSPNEKVDIESRGFIANENINKEPTLYKWRNSVFSTFNCYELTDISYRSQLVGKVDFIVAIEYNKDTNYFSNIIDSLSRDTHCYIIQVNTSDYGDSRIVQPSKSESKDLVKLKGGENIYLVVDTINIKKLREFQKKGYCLQKDDKKSNFKLTPPNFKILNYRK